MDIGRPGPGSIMDADDDLSLGPLGLILTPGPVNVDNLTQTAGSTFMGQFMDHDMTFDTASRLGVPTQPHKSPNARTPRFDLDSVYAGGPTVNPHLYEPADPARLIVGSNVGPTFAVEDLHRNATTLQAIIPDPRNDENLVIAGLHAAFQMFHNRAVDEVRATTPGLTDADTFERAREQTIWHYQWMILHEFLPLFVGQDVVDDIRTNGRDSYTPSGEASIPVEFQGAAYRFGHSMVRPSYRANFGRAGSHPETFLFIFDPRAPVPADPADPEDMRGGARATRRFIDWQTFFRFPGFEAITRPNKKIDTKISSALFRLPRAAIPAPGGPDSLPQRNLLRHVTWRMPSGQRIAERMGIPPLSAADLSDLAGYSLGLETSTPLWFYVLREAQIRAAGDRLHGVGARIVGEVIIGLIETDSDSFLNAAPVGWVPTLGGAGASFRMADFLTFAGVDPVSRGFSR